MTSTDSQIQQRISHQLQQDDQTDAEHVQVSVKGGVVTLSGEVPTEDDYVATRTVAWSTDDVTDVVNELSVKPLTAADASADKKIEVRVRDRLAKVRNLVTEGIQIDVHAGIVVLTGTVTAHWEKESAQTKMAGIAGIGRVLNLLAVVPTGNESDLEIARRVVAALEREQMVDARKITVEVADGVVTLTGTVAGWTSHGIAENAAAFTAGVTGIHNRLTVPM